MPIHPQFLVRDLRGNPVPSPELVDKLRKYDPRIGLFYTKAAWAITETWREDDPRRERIQKGEMQPEYAFDICGYLPVTCALDEAPAYIARELTSWSPAQFKGLREAVNKWNTEGLDNQVMDTVLSAVSNDLDKSNIVTPGAYLPVTFDLPTGEPEAAPPFDFSHNGSALSPVASADVGTATPAQQSSIAKAREALAQKRAERQADKQSA